MSYQHLPKCTNLASALQSHLEAFACSSTWLFRACYPGMSMSSYARSYREAPRRPLKGQPSQRLLVHRSFTRAKVVSLDEAALGLGDASVCHFFSGLGRPLIGEALETHLLGLGLHQEELPSEARRGFPGRAMVLGSKGDLVIPLYLGCGRQSQERFVTDIEARWLDTWNTVLSLEGISGVTVVAHGLCSYRGGQAVLQSLSRLVAEGAESRGSGALPRALRRLSWRFVLLEFNTLPLHDFQGQIHYFRRHPDGVLRHARNHPNEVHVTPKPERKWLWEPVTI